VNALPEPFGSASDEANSGFGYCQRRRNEIDRLIEDLKAGPQALSPDDDAFTGAALVNRTVLILRKHAALRVGRGKALTVA